MNRIIVKNPQVFLLNLNELVRQQHEALTEMTKASALGKPVTGFQIADLRTNFDTAEKAYEICRVMLDPAYEAILDIDNDNGASEAQIRYATTPTFFDHRSLIVAAIILLMLTLVVVCVSLMPWPGHAAQKPFAPAESRWQWTEENDAVYYVRDADFMQGEKVIQQDTRVSHSF